MKDYTNQKFKTKYIVSDNHHKNDIIKIFQAKNNDLGNLNKINSINNQRNLDTNINKNYNINKNKFSIRNRSVVCQISKINEYNSIYPKSNSNDYREESIIRQLKSIFLKPIIDLNKLREKCWNGVPLDHPIIHALSWKYLMGVYPPIKKIAEDIIIKHRLDYLKKVYFYFPNNSIKPKMKSEKEQDLFLDIEKDVPRTLPDAPFFENFHVKLMLTRILYIWSIENLSCSYVQGLNDLCIPFFIVYFNEYLNDVDVNTLLSRKDLIQKRLNEKSLYEIESDIYESFNNLMKEIIKNYIPDQPGIKIILNKLNEMIKIGDRELYSHLNKYGVNPYHFAFRWTNCYLIREFNIVSVLRIWDTYLSEINSWNNFHVFVCQCLLFIYKKKILELCDFQDIVMFLQNLPTKKWTNSQIEELMAEAYVEKERYGEKINKFNKYK